MRRLVIALALVIIPAAGSAAHENFSINGDDCTARNFHWNDSPAFVTKQTIDGRGLRAIKANVTQAPVSVIGDSTSGYWIDVCKAAARAEDLNAIRVTLDGDELRATGPDNRSWTVMYKIHVPRNADVQIEAKNGPLSFRNVDGTIVARSHNGPLSLRNVSGNVDATTKNGPISVHGGSGTLKVEASNGPLSVHLDGNSWLGTLDASTKNGPLSVKIPRGYNSGVVVEASGRGPFSCRAEGCERWRAARSADDDDNAWHSERPRRIELGNGQANVHLSTVNGPVTIKEEE
ncbi:MAG: hypothetical protein M3P06_07660 [Acidobacteriota bacterium]|nr:hypothetical protein [Acidobacteriota bacterium]